MKRVVVVLVVIITDEEERSVNKLSVPKDVMVGLLKKKKHKSLQY